jgi:hypothetical protein
LLCSNALLILSTTDTSAWVVFLPEKNYVGLNNRKKEVLKKTNYVDKQAKSELFG